jgi:hypothetical protein
VWTWWWNWSTCEAPWFKDVFRGELIPNWQNNVNIDARSLSAGMYQIRISAPGSVTTKKLLLTE